MASLRYRLRSRLVAAVLLSGLVAGCTNIEPFVHRPEEFNRSAPGFGRTPDDIDRVDICYARQGTTPETVSSLAAEECGRYGKRAVFAGQDVLNCPLIAPARARYQCVAPR